MNGDVDLLRTFVVAADHLHFARAAELLHLDPSGVSRHVRALEAKLGSSLFVRTTRRVEVSEFGRMLLPLAREVVDAHDRFTAAARSAARASTGVIRFGIQTHTISAETVGAIQALVTEVGFRRIEFVEANFSDTSAGVRSGDTDAAIVFTPMDDRDLRLLPTRRLPRVVLVRADHPLAGREQVTLAEVADEQWVVPITSDTAFYDFWMATAERGADNPLIEGARCRTSEEGLMAVLAGYGIAVGATARSDFQPAGLVSLAMPDLDECGVAIAVRSEADPRTASFADRLAERLRA